ncbi:MAG: HAD family hydrolase [Corynebacterium sp.]|nr:HAD family hydrolase [Corynebacterium sp.]
MEQHLLLTCDLDGTIIFERDIAAADIAAIQQWRAAGHIAVCNTGKSLKATQHALQGKGLEFDYYILYTGAVLTDHNFTVLREHHLDERVVQNILELLQDRSGIGVYATTLDGPDQQIFYTIPPELGTDILQTSVPSSPETLRSHRVIGIPIWVPDTMQCPQLLTELQETFGAVADVHQNQDFIDIVPCGANKGIGLKELEDYLADQGISTVTYSLGDSFNDLDMHAQADYSSAFDHSPLAVKEAADTVSGTAAEYILKILDEL